VLGLIPITLAGLFVTQIKILILFSSIFGIFFICVIFLFVFIFIYLFIYLFLLFYFFIYFLFFLKNLIF